MTRKPTMKEAITSVMKSAGALDSYNEAIKNGESFYLKATVDQYMPLVVEVLEYMGEISIAHYFPQNGDLMRDPEYVFTLDGWHPVEVTMDLMGFYQRAKPGYSLGNGAAEFCRTWAQNILDQGFADPTRATYKVSGDHEEEEVVITEQFSVEDIRVGSKVVSSGYHGTVTRVCDWDTDLIEVRLGSGEICVSRDEFSGKYDSCYIVSI